MSMIDQLTGDTPRREDRKNKFALSPLERAALELNDAGNARRLLAAYGPDLIFVSGKGWGVWDGTRYSFQSGPLRAAEVAARLPALIQEEIEAYKSKEFSEISVERFRRNEAEKARNPRRFLNAEEAIEAMRRDKIIALTKHKNTVGNVDKQNKALKAIEWQVRAEIHDLDADPWALVVQNGVVDLRRVFSAPPVNCESHAPTAVDLAEWRKDWLVPVDRSFRPTKCAGTPFVAGAICPEWEVFMELILPDPRIRHCLQRAMGALLFGSNESQAALLLRGGSGGNGKSTLMSIIGEVLGNFDGYAEAAKVELFLQTQNQSAGQATPEEVDLPGARAILASEPAVTDVFSAKKIKSLTGGDLRPARALGMPQFKYRPTGIPVIQFNRTPRIKDDDGGTRRRLVFFPFDVNLRELPPEKRRSPLEAERALRAELPGILNWMLDGFRDYYIRLEEGRGVPPGIDPPAEMLDLKDRIMESADPVGTFLKECAVIDEKGRTRTSEFFRAFKAWARDTGARVFTDAALRDNLTEKGFIKGKSNGVMVFKGFKWKDDPLVETYLAEATPPTGGGVSGYSESDFQ